MDNQVEKLKINVSNISNYLFKSNKELKNLKLQKKNLFSNIENKKILKSKENKLETKNLGIGSSVSKISDVAISPIKNIFDKIFDFFGLIALGKLLQELPKIIRTIDEFFKSDFVKSIGDVMRIIGVGFKTLGDFIGILPESKRNELDKDLKEIEKESDDALRLSNESDREIGGFDRDLKNNQNNNNNNNNSNSNRSSNNTTQPISNNRQNSQPTPSASPMVPRRSSSNSTNNNSQTTPEKRLSRGGTVTGNTSSSSAPTQAYTPKNPRKSGQLKQAERGMSNGFEDFSSAVNNITQTSNKDTKNMLALADLSKNFREWSYLSQQTRIRGPGIQDQRDPQADRQQQYSEQTYASGAHIGATGDLDGNQTGLDMNLPGGIGSPIYAPFDLIYRSKGTDGMPSVGLQGTSDVLGPSGRGFGYYGAYYFKRDNKEYEVLMGHFKNVPYKGTREGEVIPKGTLLGYQGASGRTIGNGNEPYPHISLHVNGVGFRASNSLLVDVANGLMNAGPSSRAIRPEQVIPLSGQGADPQLRGLTISPAGGGGGRRLNRIGNGSGNQSVFVYAVQPVENYVPFPYPVPTQSPVIPTPVTPTVPPIWRP